MHDQQPQMDRQANGLSKPEPSPEWTLPTISVITVTYNAADTIEKTIASVQSQTYQSIEHIFVDGASTDETCRLIQKSAPTAKLISEPDQGIYDAMNKGTKLATGDWIIYMNAGDRFHDASTLDSVFRTEQFDESVDFIYGDIIAQFADYRLHYPPPPLSSMWRGKPFNHQALFTRLPRALEYPFDLQFRICADHDAAYYHYKRGRKFQYVPVIVAVADYCHSAVGSDFWDVRGETVRVTNRHETNWLLKLRLRMQIIRILLVKRILPKSIVQLVRARKYRSAD